MAQSSSRLGCLLSKTKFHQAMTTGSTVMNILRVELWKSGYTEQLVNNSLNLKGRLRRLCFGEREHDVCTTCVSSSNFTLARAVRGTSAVPSKNVQLQNIFRSSKRMKATPLWHKLTYHWRLIGPDKLKYSPWSRFHVLVALNLSYIKNGGA